MLKYSSEDVEKGIVTFFDGRPEKRFGFMLDASGKKVFFHYNNGGNHGSRTRNRMPMKDDEIHFIRIDVDDRGPKARLWAFDRFDVVYDMRIKGWLKEGERLPQPDGEVLRALVNVGSRRMPSLEEMMEVTDGLIGIQQGIMSATDILQLTNEQIGFFVRNTPDGKKGEALWQEFRRRQHDKGGDDEYTFITFVREVLKEAGHPLPSYA